MCLVNTISANICCTAYQYIDMTPEAIADDIMTCEELQKLVGL